MSTETAGELAGPVALTVALMPEEIRRLKEWLEFTDEEREERARRIVEEVMNSDQIRALSEKVGAAVGDQLIAVLQPVLEEFEARIGKLETMQVDLWARIEKIEAVLFRERR